MKTFSNEVYKYKLNWIINQHTLGCNRISFSDMKSPYVLLTDKKPSKIIRYWCYLSFIKENQPILSVKHPNISGGFHMEVKIKSCHSTFYRIAYLLPRFLAWRHDIGGKYLVSDWCGSTKKTVPYSKDGNNVMFQYVLGKHDFFVIYFNARSFCGIFL